MLVLGGDGWRRSMQFIIFLTDGSPPQNARAIDRRDAGTEDCTELPSGPIDLSGDNGDAVLSFFQRREEAGRELMSLFVEQGYGAGLRELRLAKYPAWLPHCDVVKMVEHMPQLEAIDVPCFGDFKLYDAPSLPPPSLRRLTLRAHSPFRWPLIQRDVAPNATTLEIYNGAAYWSYGPPTPSPALVHYRLRGGDKQGGNVTPWTYPQLRTLEIQAGFVDKHDFVDGQ